MNSLILVPDTPPACGGISISTTFISFGLYFLYLSGLNRGSVSTLNLGKSLYPVPM
jgi:hypothetical protein